MKPIFLLLLLAILQLTTAASAQDSSTIARLKRDLAAARLRVSGTFGRVELPRSEIAMGGIRGDTGTAAYVVLPWADIRRVEKRGSSAERGALIGGGISLFLAAASLASNDCSGPASLACASSAAATVLLIPVGTGIGALIGLGVGHWSTVYRHPSEPSQEVVEVGKNFSPW